MNGTTIAIHRQPIQQLVYVCSLLCSNGDQVPNFINCKLCLANDYCVRCNACTTKHYNNLFFCPRAAYLGHLNCTLSIDGIACLFVNCPRANMPHGILFSITHNSLQCNISLWGTVNNDAFPSNL